MRCASGSPSLGSTTSRRAGRAAVALLGAGALALAACGGDDTGGESGGEDVAGVGPIRANSTAQFASCSDWRRGTEEERYATIEDIRGQLTPQRSATAESDLPDSAAYAMFQKVCATDFSDSLRLYKLYAHAQAFAPLRPELAED